MKNLLNILDRFIYKNIIVVGDIMLDHYFVGKPSMRMSPEAPIPINFLEKEWFVPGGAGNTAMNIKKLGAKVTLVGKVGNDSGGRIVLNHFANEFVETKTWFHFGTIEKIRCLSDGKHIVRLDKECIKYLSAEIEERVIWFLKEKIKSCDAVLVSDYNKGFITKKIAKELVRISREHKKMLIVDTKPEHFLWFKGCYCIKPNKIEAEKFAGIKIESSEDALNSGIFIRKSMDAKVLLTLGFMGMMCFGEEGVDHFASHAKNVFDVTGAGDTVLAVFSLALSSGASLVEATGLANRAAAIVIAKLGTATITLEELKNSIN